jgi:ketosteroid isomerase-like protein
VRSICEAIEERAVFEEEKAVVQRWLDLLTGDVEDVWGAFRQVMAEDAVWIVPGQTPVSGTHQGLESINRDFFEKCWETGDGRGSGVQGLSSDYGLTMTIEQVVALEDGRVLVTCTSDARGKNGLAYNNGYCWIIKVADGKITEVLEYCDTMMFETAMFDKRLVPAEDLQSA